MSTGGAPRSVMRAAVLAPLLPAGLIAAQMAALVTLLTDARVAVAVVAAAAAAGTGWGASSGVRRPPRRGPVERMAFRVGGGVVVLLVALGVRLIAVAAPPPTGGGLGGVPLLDGATIVVLIALLPFIATGRSLGRAYRRQADPKTTRHQRRDADRVVPAMLLSGAVVVGLISTVGSAAGVTGSVIARAVPLVWLVVAAVIAVTARGVVLDARSAPSAAPGLAGWARRTAPVALGVVAVALAGALALSAAGDVWQGDWLPALPSGLVGVLDPPAPEREPAGEVDPAPPPAEFSIPTVATVLLAAVVVLLVLVALPRARRVVRVWRTDARTSLLDLLRELFGSREVERRTDDGDEIAIAPSDTTRTVRMPARFSSWVRRLRPRPSDPAAAIMYDYQRVQDRFPPDRRRRQPETVLTHAHRVQAAALDELADLVCAIRYAGRSATRADAERSRQLTRTLTRR